MKGFIEIPANDRHYKFAINISHILTIVKQQDYTAIELINGKKHFVDASYEEIEELIQKSIDGTGGNESKYNDPNTPFTV